ncbi:hypothetical protein O181_058825 [Austropuccinia psidii MF-1]|uniref:SNF2 N-terminal domain-containing protein n=1 Tax=Austropuccinia psidii MF-1 TaxID=1389203 RepID=A0A9Q3EHB1_9BASI|nr:hypothetical protein [Austropuccinia psidii MF-1]
MENPPVIIGPPHPLDPLLIPGTTLETRSSAHLNLFQTIPPLGGLLVDDMGLGKAIKAIALISTSKQWLIINSYCSTPTSLNNQLEARNIQEFSGWSIASQHLPWPHLSLII